MNTDQVWLAAQFGRASLGDVRRCRRAQKLALSMLQAPNQGLAAQTQTWGNCKGAYRLLNCEAVTHRNLLQPHCEQTRQDAGELPVVLFVQDTTELDFTSMAQAKGYGPIGDHRGQGLLVHSLLSLSPDGEVLGLAAQRCWARVKDRVYTHTETRTQRCARKDKESDVWHQVLSDAGGPPPGKRWISIGDRGSDSFIYWAKARDMGWQCLSRIFIDRRTVDQNHLVSLARCLPSRGQMGLHQRARAAQSERTVQLQMAWQRVEVQPARNDSYQRHIVPLQASVLRCWDDEHELEWVLLATWAIDTWEQACECVQWYKQRWRIEEWHKCLKTGCRIERSQLKSAQATQALLGFCSVIATRLLALTRAVKAHPQVRAIEQIEGDYIQVLCSQQGLCAQTLSVADYWREVARMGGFLARKHDKAPGWQTLWRGLSKLDDMVVGYRLGSKTQCG